MISEVVSDSVSDIVYSALEQSCNVLNYTKLSELVVQKKESSGPKGVVRVLLLAACCIYSSEGKNEMFRFSKTSSGGFGGKPQQSWHEER